MLGSKKCFLFYEMEACEIFLMRAFRFSGDMQSAMRGGDQWMIKNIKYLTTINFCASSTEKGDISSPERD